MAFQPYFQCGPEWAKFGEAYLRVRVAEYPNPNGYVGVYLPTGTRLDVRGTDLLRLIPTSESIDRPDVWTIQGANSVAL